MGFATALVKYVENDLAMLLIAFAYATLLYYIFQGKKVQVPGPYFLLVGLGSALMTYSLVKRNKPTHVVVLEAFMAFSSLFIYFK